MLREIREILDLEEEKRFSRWATLSRMAVREKKEDILLTGHRQWFSVMPTVFFTALHIPVT